MNENVIEDMLKGLNVSHRSSEIFSMEKDGRYKLLGYQGKLTGLRQVKLCLPVMRHVRKGHCHCLAFRLPVQCPSGLERSTFPEGLKSDLSRVIDQ